MKVLLLLFVLFYLNYYTLYAIEIKSQKIDYLDQKNLNIQNKRQELENLKKIIVILALKKHYHKKIFNSDKDSNGTFNYGVKYRLVNSMYLAMEKEIKLKEKKLKTFEKNHLNANKSEDIGNFSLTATEETEKIEIYDPIADKPTIPGKYNVKLKEKTTIKAPFEGIVKKISFKGGKTALILENEKCQAYLDGLSNVNVTLGQKINTLEPVGISSEPYFFYEIICK